MVDPHADYTWGPVHFALGENGGKYPSINTLWIEGDELTVCDPGGPKPIVEALAARRPGRVLLSHVHGDHVRRLGLFPDVPIWTHPAERPMIEDFAVAQKRYGLTPAFLAWRQKQYPNQKTATYTVHATFEDGDELDLGGVRMQIVHTPGHSPGHCCFAFPDQRVIYIADIDLTRFGPWYGNAACSLADYRATLARMREVEADAYLTAHEAGVVEGREDFLKRLHRFEARIDERMDRLLDALKEPRTLDDLLRLRLIYLRKKDPEPFDFMETWMHREHLKELMAQGKVIEDNGTYRLA